MDGASSNGWTTDHLAVQNRVIPYSGKGNNSRHFPPFVGSHFLDKAISLSFRGSVFLNCRLLSSIMDEQSYITSMSELDSRLGKISLAMDEIPPQRFCPLLDAFASSNGTTAELLLCSCLVFEKYFNWPFHYSVVRVI